jgi:hypothetical protein
MAAQHRKISKATAVYGTIFVLSMLPVLPFCLVCLLLTWAYSLKPALDDHAFRQSLKVYPNASALFEDTSPATTHSREVNLIYWTADSVESVMAFHSAENSAFVPGNKAGDWFISANDKTIPEVIHAYLGYLRYYDLCGDSLYRCVTVSLVKGHNPTLCSLQILNVGDGFHKQRYENCDRIPKNGTLIIYTYRIEG